MYVSPMESFAFVDVKVKMRESLINLVSQHPVLYDKHFGDYLNNQVKDNI